MPPAPGPGTRTQPGRRSGRRTPPAPGGRSGTAELETHLRGAKIVFPTLGGMLDRARYGAGWVGDARKMSGAWMKTFTRQEDRKRSARCDRRGNGKGSRGMVTLLGGTGCEPASNAVATLPSST